jgi:hypothetical protein
MELEHCNYRHGALKGNSRACVVFSDIFRVPPLNFSLKQPIRPLLSAREPCSCRASNVPLC